MKAVGIVVEYNPFHNGHLYHLEQVKKQYENYVVIAIMSGNFMQRGAISILSKWQKTEIALKYGVDIVLDLPFVYANESADFFASNAIKILNHFKISALIFGSESGNVELYKKYAEIQLNNKQYDDYVKEYLATGKNYPTACSNALNKLTGGEVNTPNDILGLSYTKAIMKNNLDIEVGVVQRTNDYHSKDITEVASATSIRNAVENNLDYEIAVPNYTLTKLKEAHLYNNNDFYNYLQYKIISSSKRELQQIHLVEEGLENRLKELVYTNDTYDDFVKQLSTKRYTYSRVSRMLWNIIINYTKEERAEVEKNDYFRVLGFSSRGQQYLKMLNDQEINYDVSIKTINNVISSIEYRCSKILNLIDSTYIENDKIKKVEI